MNENEYRYLIGGDARQLKKVENLSEYLVGIVLGEKIDPVSEWQIKSLTRKLNKERGERMNGGAGSSLTIEMKKIRFGYRYNELLDVDDERGGDEDVQ